MKLLEQTLAEISKSAVKYPALMTHAVLGYPTLKDSMEIVQTMAENGAKIIELQFPFSDPIADGPTIMEASEHTLAQGVTPYDCMKALEKLSRKVEVPLLIMSYFNLLFAYGNKKNESGMLSFLKDARSAGAEGLIVPDVPLEEEGHDSYWSSALSHRLFPVPLVSPVSGEARLKKIAKAVPGGFVYCVSQTGTTGSRKELPAHITDYLKTVRKHLKRPLAVGFGISSPAHLKALGGKAEIAIVGSAMINVIRTSEKGKALQAVRKFTRQLAKG